MQHDVNTLRVEHAVSTVLRELNGLPYSEALLAAAESLARLIVGVSSTPIQMQDMVAVAHEHMQRTIKAGASAKGFRVN
jgi:hypothetical protein